MIRSSKEKKDDKEENAAISAFGLSKVFSVNSGCTCGMGCTESGPSSSKSAPQIVLGSRKNREASRAPGMSMLSPSKSSGVASFLSCPFSNLELTEDSAVTKLGRCLFSWSLFPRAKLGPLREP